MITFCCTVSRISASPYSFASRANSIKSPPLIRPTGTSVPTAVLPSRCRLSPTWSPPAPRDASSPARASGSPMTRSTSARKRSIPHSARSTFSRDVLRLSRDPWSRKTLSTAVAASTTPSGPTQASSGSASLGILPPSAPPTRTLKPTRPSRSAGVNDRSCTCALVQSSRQPVMLRLNLRGRLLNPPSLDFSPMIACCKRSASGEAS